jgi:dsRNA-specific ribonuclease
VIIWAQKNKHDFEFNVEKHLSGTDDERFVAHLLIDGQEVALGKGRNKKTAQQRASKNAIDSLGIVEA